MNKINYTRSERNAIIVLLCIIICLIILKQPIVKMMTSNAANQIKEDSIKYFALQQQIEDARTTYYNSNNNYKYKSSRSKEERNFKIEINSATKEEFEKLYGIGNVFADRIIKYRTKIGGFSSIEQIKEVYGIHDTVFQKFKHNLSIIPIKNNGITATSKQKKIEINAATMEDLLQLKGIGNVYAKRIFEFREKLGGFYALEQIKDVYGIHDSVYQKFINQIYIQPKSIQKININTATLEELMSNPYFFSTFAKQIIGYRTKVKPFESVEDLKKIYYIRDNPSYYNKILPYVSL